MVNGTDVMILCKILVVDDGEVVGKGRSFDLIWFLVWRGVNGAGETCTEDFVEEEGEFGGRV